MAVELAKFPAFLPIHNDGKYEKYHFTPSENSPVRRGEDQTQAERA